MLNELGFADVYLPMSADVAVGIMHAYCAIPPSVVQVAKAFA